MVPAKSDPLSKLKVGDYALAQYHRRLIIRRRLTTVDIVSYIFAALSIYGIGFQLFVQHNLTASIGFIALFTAISLFGNRRHAPIVFDLDSKQITRGKKVLGSCDMVQILVTGDAISKTLAVYGPETEIWSITSNSKSKIAEIEKSLTAFLPPELERFHNLAKFHDPNADIFAPDDSEELEEEVNKD